MHAWPLESGLWGTGSGRPHLLEQFPRAEVPDELLLSAEDGAEEAGAGGAARLDVMPSSRFLVLLPRSVMTLNVHLQPFLVLGVARGVGAGNSGAPLAVGALHPH